MIHYPQKQQSTRDSTKNGCK